MFSFLGVFIGGGMGSVLRWLVCVGVPAHWGTFTVNVAGAFFIGMAYTFFQRCTGVAPELKLFVMSGLLGGFTTFSTYLLDFARLAGQGRAREAAIYLACSVLFGTAALIAGMKCLG